MISEIHIGGNLETGLYDWSCTKNPGHTNFIIPSEMSEDHVCKYLFDWDRWVVCGQLNKFCHLEVQPDLVDRDDSDEQNSQSEDRSVNSNIAFTDLGFNLSLRDRERDNMKKLHEFAKLEVARELDERFGLSAKDIVDAVKACAPLMVRVQVKHVGEACLFNVGSGWIRKVYEFKDMQNGRTLWQFYIYTAHHVCSKSQMSDTCVTVFDEKHPGLELSTLSGGRYWRGDSEKDWSYLEFTTYDQ